MNKYSEKENNVEIPKTTDIYIRRGSVALFNSKTVSISVVT